MTVLKDTYSRGNGKVRLELSGLSLLVLLPDSRDKVNPPPFHPSVNYLGLN